MAVESAGEPGFEPGFTVLETVRIAVNSLPRGGEVYDSAIRKYREHTFVSYERTDTEVKAVSMLLGAGPGDGRALRSSMASSVRRNRCGRRDLNPQALSSTGT
jgi:hypothetical protein